MYVVVLILLRFGWLVAPVLAAIAIIAPQPSRHITIETGPVGGSYHAAALKYAIWLKQQGLKVKLLPNGDSSTIIDHVNDPDSETSLGFIVEQFDRDKYRNVFSLGSTEYQPLFVFYRRELNDVDNLEKLKGHRLIFPARTSATTSIALNLLSKFDLTDKNTSMMFGTLDDAGKALMSGDADAGFFVLATNHPLIQQLGARDDLKLMQFSHREAIEHLMPNLAPVAMPSGTFSLKDDLPPNQVPLLATTTEIVAKRKLDPAIVYLVLQALSNAQGDDRLAKTGEFPSARHSTLPISPAAKEYYASGVPWDYRNLPLPVAVLFRYYTILLPLVVILPLWDLLGLQKPIAISPNVLLNKGYRQLYRYLLKRAEQEIEEGSPAHPSRERSLIHVLDRIERKYAAKDANNDLAVSARRIRELLEERASPAKEKADVTEAPMTGQPERLRTGT